MSPKDYKYRRSVVVWGVPVGVCLACDFMMVPALGMVPVWPVPGVTIFLSSVGCVLAQGCLLAAWLVWSDQRFWQRFTRHWIIAAILYLAWALGLAAVHPSEFARLSSFVGLSVPLVSVAAQTPLWIARQMFGWRLIRGRTSEDRGLAPLSIRGLMVATVTVSLVLAVARLAPSPDGKEIGGVWIVMFVMASGVSAVAFMPASALLLRTQQFQRGLLFSALYAAFWVGLVWLVILVARHTGLFHVPPFAIVLGVSFLIISFAATVMVAAAAARAGGYRLVWGRRGADGTNGSAT